jgi:hypothetical protein
MLLTIIPTLSQTRKQVFELVTFCLFVTDSESNDTT